MKSTRIILYSGEVTANDILMQDMPLSVTDLAVRQATNIWMWRPAGPVRSLLVQGKTICISITLYEGQASPDDLILSDMPSALISMIPSQNADVQMWQPAGMGIIAGIMVGEQSTQGVVSDAEVVEAVETTVTATVTREPRIVLGLPPEERQLYQRRRGKVITEQANQRMLGYGTAIMPIEGYISTRAVRQTTRSRGRKSTWDRDVRTIIAMIEADAA